MKISIIEGPIEMGEINDGRDGAKISFQGIVRGTENGSPIKGIRYSCYPSMATKELKRIVASCSLHSAEIFHSVGFVPVGKSSLVIRVSTPHSKEAFEHCSLMLSKIKTQVPIWKEIIFD